MYRYGEVVRVNMAGIPVVVLHGYKTVREAFGQHQLSARPELHITTRDLTNGIGELLNR